MVNYPNEYLLKKVTLLEYIRKDLIYPERARIRNQLDLIISKYKDIYPQDHGISYKGRFFSSNVYIGTISYIPTSPFETRILTSEIVAMLNDYIDEDHLLETSSKKIPNYISILFDDIIDINLHSFLMPDSIKFILRSHGYNPTDDTLSGKESATIKLAYLRLESLLVNLQTNKLFK